MNRKLALIASCALGLGMSACSSGPSYDYYRLHSRFVASPQDQSAPEIITTPAYSQFAGGATTVAVRAPDRCSNNTANQTTGDAAAAGTILQTNCGIEMGEIERALTRAGYNVISWNILDREMARTNSASQAAAGLGAQVLFQVNSLERSEKTLGVDARWERTYYSTNYAGNKDMPLPLTEASRQLLSSRFLAPIEARNVPRAPAVTLDAVAVWVPSGQSMWYYRWTRAGEPQKSAAAFSLRLACLQGYGFANCSPSDDPSAPEGPASTVLAAGESVALSAGERPEDRQRAVYLELVKQVVSNFVNSFARARQFAATPAAAAAPAPAASDAAPTQ